MASSHAPSSNSHAYAPKAAKPQPIRWLVRHLHGPQVLPDGSTAPSADVTVSYSASMKDSLSYAISTASRYAGIIYGDFGDTDHRGDPLYSFFRSYKPGSGRIHAG